MELPVDLETVQLIGARVGLRPILECNAQLREVPGIRGHQNRVLSPGQHREKEIEI